MTSININEVIMINDDIKRNIKTLSSVIADLGREIKRSEDQDDDTDLISLQINRLRNTRDNMKKLTMTLDSVIRLFNTAERKAAQLFDGYVAGKVASYSVSINDLTNVSDVSAPYSIV